MAVAAVVESKILPQSANGRLVVMAVMKRTLMPAWVAAYHAQLFACAA
jgi:hypothetical protein